MADDGKEKRQVRLTDALIESTQEHGSTILGTLTKETGETQDITAEHMREAMENLRAQGGHVPSADKRLSVIGVYDGNIVEVEVKPLPNNAAGDLMPLIIDGSTGHADLLPGRYFYIIGEDMPLLATEESQVTGEGITLEPYTVTVRDFTPNESSNETANDTPHDLKLWMLRIDETGELVTFYDLISGIAAQAAMKLTIEYLEDRGLLFVNGDAGAARGLSISTTELKKIDFPTDKVNREVWNLWAGLKPGQLAVGFSEDGSADIGINLANSKDRARGILRTVTYHIDFSGLEDMGIAPKLEPYDKRVYEALSSLWRHITCVTGRDTFSLKEIHYAMGYESNPSATTKQNINDSLTKMGNTNIFVDNIDEASAYNYPHFTWDAKLLPMERMTGYVDGQITDGLIHLYREPPLFAFARERGQITSYSIKLLQTPVNKTNKILSIEDYLRDQIAWMRNEGNSSRRSNKITFDGLFKAAGVTRRDDKGRQKDTARKILSHYIKCEFIRSFAEDSDGFTIEC